MQLRSSQIQSFQDNVWEYYRLHRRTFPWRSTHLPYHVLVSEVMLQQTQIDRVVPFFRRFIKFFPTVRSLARANLSRVMEVWSGLGYNRRGLLLKRAAQQIVREHRGIVPENFSYLDALPGIGKYSAGAIRAFAFNKPEVFIETNIRTVYLHHFFKRNRAVPDKRILVLVEETLDGQNPREWYEALMDYGAMLKRTVGNVNVKSATYHKQSPFHGSRRELRGKLVRLALETTITPTRLKSFCTTRGIARIDAQSVLATLEREGFLAQRQHSFTLR